MRRGPEIRAAVAVFLLLPMLAAGCGRAGEKEADRETETGSEKGTTMDKWHIDEACDFTALEVGLMDWNACSPAFDDPETQGLVIHAPAEVIYDPDQPDEATGAFADVRLCGTCNVDYSYLGLRGEVTEEILLVVVDASTHETWSGKMEPILNPEERPDDLGGEAGPTEGLLVESYFNPNLAETLDLPARPAEYIVYATLGDYKSNTVRIQVKERS